MACAADTEILLNPCNCPAAADVLLGVPESFEFCPIFSNCVPTVFSSFWLSKLAAMLNLYPWAGDLEYQVC